MTNEKKPKEAYIQFRCTPSEKQKIRDYARSIGVGMSAFIKSVVLREINREGYQNG